MRRAFAPLVERRTWQELLYALLGLPLGIAGFVFVITGLSVSAGLAVTLVGVPLLAVVVTIARGAGGVYRGLGRTLLGVSVDTPVVQRRPGLAGYLFERHGWRALLFLLVNFPIAIFDFVLAAVLWSYGLAGVTYPLWFWSFSQRDSGVRHRGVELGSHYFLDTPARVIASFVVGVLLLVIAPRVLRAALWLNRVLIRDLLGPSAEAQRIQSLESTRSLAVEDSAASLRRIERDLHDGAQARLVALAMSLGLAKEELEAEDSAIAMTRVRELVDSAHREAKGTIVDLRDLARGIHPPALDNGLPDALGTLGARCSVATTVAVELAQRPTPAVETIVYFCTAELLTNVVKHSGAHRATVDVRDVSDHLLLRVGDDGAGGAALNRAGGSGLTGLADRIATVDGRLDIASPEGGPTVITIDIPL